MPNSFAAQELPRKRTGGPLAWLDRQSIGSIAFIGLLLYLFVVLSVSVIEFAFHYAGLDLVLNDKGLGEINFPTSCISI